MPPILSPQEWEAARQQLADGFNGLLPHLHACDVTMLLVSREPLETLQAYKRRMGWSIRWASSASDFTFDFTEQRILEACPNRPRAATSCRGRDSGHEFNKSTHNKGEGING